MQIKTVLTMTYEIKEELLKKHELTHSDALNRLEQQHTNLDESIRSGLGNSFTNVKIHIVTEEV